MKISGIKELKAAAAKIRSIPEAAQRAAYRSVNTVTAKVATQASRDIAAQINLPKSYIMEQINTTQATMENARAMIRMRRRGIGLARFGAIQLTKVAPLGRKGDSLRKIAKGRKQAGISVKVSSKGSRKTLPRAFLIPLRAGKIDGGNGFGVFIRDGSAGPRSGYAGLDATLGKYKWRGDIRHLYGPSPDQVFRRWRNEVAPDIKRMLADAYQSQFRYELTGRRR